MNCLIYWERISNNLVSSAHLLHLENDRFAWQYANRWRDASAVHDIPIRICMKWFHGRINLEFVFWVKDVSTGFRPQQTDSYYIPVWWRKAKFMFILSTTTDLYSSTNRKMRSLRGLNPFFTAHESNKISLRHRGWLLWQFLLFFVVLNIIGLLHALLVK